MDNDLRGTRMKRKTLQIAFDLRLFQYMSFMGAVRVIKKDHYYALPMPPVVIFCFLQNDLRELR